MFTGIVESGDVVKVETAPDGGQMWVRSELLTDCDIGASVAINGVCLTVTDRDGDVCRFDLALETLARSTLGDYMPGARVNVERPLRAGDELGGHIVQGHVDGVGVIASLTADRDGRRLRIAVPRELARYIVEKGSVAVDGVSLTVTAVTEDSFEIALIPHTLAVTSFGMAEVGMRVNVEVDVVAKYVERLVGPATSR